MEPRTGSWKGVLFGVALGAFAAYQQFKLPVVLPVLLERYGYERALAGGFVSVYALAGLLLSVWIGGRLERHGALPPVFAAMGLIVAGSLLTLVQPSSGGLVLLARALEGFGFAALAVAGPVLANANAPVRHASLVVGLSAMWIPIGQLVATGLAPLALATSGWTLLWWIGIGAAALVSVFAAGLRHDPRVTLHPARHTAGGGKLTSTERRTLAVVACVFGLWSGQYFAWMTWMPQYLVEVHGLSVDDALLGYVVPVVFVALFNLVAGAVLRAGVSIGLLMTGAIASQTLAWWLLPVTGADAAGIALLVVYGIGAGIVPTCLFGSAGAVIGHGRSTAPALGILMTGRNLGVLIGPVLLALVAGDGANWDASARLFAVITAVSMLLAAVFWTRLRRAR